MSIHLYFKLFFYFLSLFVLICRCVSLCVFICLYMLYCSYKPSVDLNPEEQRPRFHTMKLTDTQKRVSKTANLGHSKICMDMSSTTESKPVACIGYSCGGWMRFRETCWCRATAGFGLRGFGCRAVSTWPAWACGAALSLISSCRRV